MPDYPTQLPAGAGTTYELRQDLYAVTRSPEDLDAGPITVINDDAQTAIAIYEGVPQSPAESTPVYASGGDGPLAVPTGRVFVRLAPGLSPSTRRAGFKAAGFSIEQLLAYAPNAAWVRPISGGVAHSLSAPALRALRAVPGVEHVEPQLLMARIPKR